MRRFVITALALCLFSSVFAQTDSTAKKKKISGTTFHASDHFMLQLGYTSWTGKPDSIHTSGLPRTFNAYIMIAFPFKSDPHWSVAIGPGISTDNIYFSAMAPAVTAAATTMRFQDLSDTIHFKKNKLSTAYLEAPIELRYSFNPKEDQKSWKLAAGIKIGTMLNAHTKQKELESSTGALLNNYIEKLSSKNFFNTTRFSVMGRAGYGHFTLFAAYSLTPVFKEGVAPTINPLTFGLTLSGL